MRPDLLEKIAYHEKWTSGSLGRSKILEMRQWLTKYKEEKARGGNYLEPLVQAQEILDVLLDSREGTAVTNLMSKEIQSYKRNAEKIDNLMVL